MHLALCGCQHNEWTIPTILVCVGGNSKTVESQKTLKAPTILAVTHLIYPLTCGVSVESVWSTHTHIALTWVACYESVGIGYLSST